MTVGELKARLAELPDRMVVIVSSDGEGNEFRRLNEAEVNMASQYGWEWEIHHPDDAPEYEDAVEVLVIWP